MSKPSNRMNATNSKITRRHSKGFSLAELLIAIAIIGIIAMLAVPVLAGAVSRSDGARDHRHAQSLSAMAGNAVAAGDLSIPAASSASEVVDLLIAGVKGSGVFEASLFQVHGLDSEEVAGALLLLQFEGGILNYKP